LSKLAEVMARYRFAYLLTASEHGGRGGCRFAHRARACRAAPVRAVPRTCCAGRVRFRPRRDCV